MIQNLGAGLVLAGSLGVAATAAVAAVAALPAQSAPSAPVVIVHGRCSGSTVTTLRLQKEDHGRLSVDFEIDMARHTGEVTWHVAESRNGVTFVHATRRSLAAGSLGTSRLLARRAGVNAVVAIATNTVTGEVCTLAAQA